MSGRHCAGTPWAHFQEPKGTRKLCFLVKHPCVGVFLLMSSFECLLPSNKIL
jgi:hypothetical protein